ncbi:MAG: hypothetical protein IIZ93_07280 [Acidaminococcaceae bacterium]|nr:hypothetical protein [Acidaminococcaceae bacterium]
MGEITDYQFRLLIERLRGIDKRLKELNATLEEHFEKTERTQPEDVDPFGYTE